MGTADGGKKTQGRDTALSRILSFRLYQPEEVENMGHSDLVALFLANQEQLREALSILAEQDRMITCLTEEKNLNDAEKYGSSSETSARLKGDKGKTARPSSHCGDEKTKRQKNRPKRGMGCIDALIKDLPVHRRDICLTREELIEKYGTDQVKEGPEKVYRTCRFIPGIWYVEEVHVHTFKDPENGAIFQPARACDFKFLPGSYLSPEVLAYVLDQRFTMAVPYYRMQKWLERNRFYLKRETLAGWAVLYDTKLFAPVVCRLWHHLLRSGNIQIDETPTIVNEVRRRDSAPSSLCYMWDFRTSELLEDVPEVVIFHFDESRGTEVLDECLPGFTGTISSDGHSPYHGFACKSGGKVLNAGCLNHARTRFVKVIRANPSFKKLSEEEQKEIPACRILELFSQIFKEDARLKDVPPQERLEGRNGTVKPLFEELAGYAILRNNIKFIDSIDGAVATADLYSLAATAKAHGTDFYTYLLYLLKKLPPILEGHKEKEFRDMDELDAFMPWSTEYRAFEQEEWTIRKRILETQNLFPVEDNRVPTHHRDTEISDKTRHHPEPVAADQDIARAQNM